MARRKKAVRKSPAKINPKKKAAAGKKRKKTSAKIKKTSRKKSPALRKKAAPAAKARKDPAAKFLKDYLKQLHAERKSGAPALAEIQHDVHSCEAECDRIKAEIVKAEELAKRRKREIDEWKLWYNGIAKIDKSEEWAKLEVEIAWRAQEINAAQKNINQLYEKHHLARTQLQILQQRLLAFEHGAFERPLQEDPRYVALMREQFKS